jgi:hypothetical protein
MRKYEVLVTAFSIKQCKRSATVTVEAKSKEQAIAQAEQMAMNDDVNWEKDEDYDPDMERFDTFVVNYGPLQRG